VAKTGKPATTRVGRRLGGADPVRRLGLAAVVFPSRISEPTIRARILLVGSRACQHAGAAWARPRLVEMEQRGAVAFPAIISHAQTRPEIKI
jgi:hypothetical protein